jgi:hypothetical protein
VIWYRLHTTSNLVSAMLFDAWNRLSGSISIDLPLLRSDGTRIRFLRGSSFWEVEVWPDRFELIRDRQLRAVLGRDHETGLWMGDCHASLLLREVSDSLEIVEALLAELDDHGILDFG